MNGLFESVCLFVYRVLHPTTGAKEASSLGLPSTDKKKKIYPQQKPVIYIQRKKIEAA